MSTMGGYMGTQALLLSYATPEIDQKRLLDHATHFLTATLKKLKNKSRAAVEFAFDHDVFR